jgi:hypothetical protein
MNTGQDVHRVVGQAHRRAACKSMMEECALSAAIILL